MNILALLSKLDIKTIGVILLSFLFIGNHLWQSSQIEDLNSQLEDSIMENQGLKALVKAERVSCNTEKIIVKETEEKEQAIRRLKEMEETIRVIKENEKTLEAKNKAISKSLDSLKANKDSCLNNKMDKVTTETLKEIFNGQ
jgi:chromosome segregation ATPase